MLLLANPSKGHAGFRALPAARRAALLSLEPMILRELELWIDPPAGWTGGRVYQENLIDG